MKTKDLEKYAQTIKEERGFTSLIIIGTKRNLATSHTLGSPYEMLMGLLSTFNHVLEEIEIKEHIKNGEVGDKNKVWDKLLKINHLINELGIK